MTGGTLQQLILHKLSERSLSGYSLVKEIERSTGHKPSFGSIYPLLERMTKDGLVISKQDGRKKMYSLTQHGKVAASEFKTQHAKLIEKMISQSKTCCELTGSDLDAVTELLERMRDGKNPLAPISASAYKLRDIIATMANDDAVMCNAKEINIILNDACKKLERLHASQKKTHATKVKKEIMKGIKKGIKKTGARKDAFA